MEVFVSLITLSARRESIDKIKSGIKIKMKRNITWCIQYKLYEKTVMSLRGSARRNTTS